MFGQYEEIIFFVCVILQINGVVFGVFVYNCEDGSVMFIVLQVVVLLVLFKCDSYIDVIGNDGWCWVLFDCGVLAVLLKMDMVQGWFGMFGVLMCKGIVVESSVLLVLLVLVMMFGKVFVICFVDVVLGCFLVLCVVLVVVILLDDCEVLGLGEGLVVGEVLQDMIVICLLVIKLLVLVGCWCVVYNIGDGYWVINDCVFYVLVLVIMLGNDDDGCIIILVSKGCGLGDCWYIVIWSWDGVCFVFIVEFNIGLCWLVVVGGVWEMFMLVICVQE